MNDGENFARKGNTAVVREAETWSFFVKVVSKHGGVRKATTAAVSKLRTEE